MCLKVLVQVGCVQACLAGAMAAVPVTGRAGLWTEGSMEVLGGLAEELGGLVEALGGPAKLMDGPAGLAKMPASMLDKVLLGLLLSVNALKVGRVLPVDPLNVVAGPRAELMRVEKSWLAM